MRGETDLAILLGALAPRLSDAPYGFALLRDGPVPQDCFATVREAEGLTVIAEQDRLAAAGLATGARWARISLTVHSDLAAVGLTAAIAAALAREAISANVVAGLHHDHIFVPWDRRAEAMAALGRLAAGAAGHRAGA